MASDREQLRRAFHRVATDDLVLRTPELGDLAAIFAIHADPATNRHNPAGPMRGPGEARVRLRHWREEWERHGFGYWTACDAGGEVVGFGGGAHRIWRERAVVNVYYRLAPAAWGRGIATTIARAVVHLAAEHLPELPVVVRTRPGNEAAIRVALRAGLQRRPDLDDDFLAFVGGQRCPEP